MASNPMFNADLIDDMARQKVVLFLGAGVSSSALTATGTRIAGWEKFLLDMCGHASKSASCQAKALIEKKDYLLACEILQSDLAESWERHVTAEYGQRATPSALHESISRLDQRIIITTNFDKLIEVALETAGDHTTHYPIVISSVDDRVFRALKDHSGRYVIKIHGTVDDAKTLIFSRSEYIRLAFGNFNYTSFLENLLLNYTFLFIGFSMDDPAICSLMELYAHRYPSSRPHYLFAPEPIESNIVDIYKRLRKLVVYPYDPINNHAKLPKTIDDLAEKIKSKKKELLANAL